MFNRFITGPAVEGREITELTEKYQKFYELCRCQLFIQQSIEHFETVDESLHLCLDCHAVKGIFQPIALLGFQKVLL